MARINAFIIGLQLHSWAFEPSYPNLPLVSSNYRAKVENSKISDDSVGFCSLVNKKVGAIKMGLSTNYESFDVLTKRIFSP
jgi:hypothetical protein